MIDAMLKEMDQRRDFMTDQHINTIYFGGGTPSLLQTDELKRLIARIYERWPVSETPEITLEANPDDLSGENLKKLKEAGINRLSIGIQSFEQSHLEWMNRGHNAQQAAECVDRARAAGFDNFNVDLIYGFPLLTDRQWENNIRQVIERKIPHLSCYSLTVEPGTALHQFIEKGQQKAPTDEQSISHYSTLVKMLKQAGYEHYEVSNFGLPGYFSKHNHSYWTGAQYLGIGPSAHSYNIAQRCWNVRNNHQYIAEIESGTLKPECETIDRQTAYNEYLLTRFRTRLGIDLTEIENQFGVDFSVKFRPQLAQLMEEKQVVQSGKQIHLTEEGMLWADQIAARFFIL